MGMNVGNWHNTYLHRDRKRLYYEIRLGLLRTREDVKLAWLLDSALYSKHVDGSLLLRECYEHLQKGGAPLAVAPNHIKFYARREAFGYKIYNDPFKVEKGREIIGLYLNSADKADLLCVEERTQIKILYRTQPLLPMDQGYVEGFTNDYIRHDTCIKFTGFSMAIDSVTAEDRPRHWHQ